MLSRTKEPSSTPPALLHRARRPVHPRTVWKRLKIFAHPPSRVTLFRTISNPGSLGGRHTTRPPIDQDSATPCDRITTNMQDGERGSRISCCLSVAAVHVYRFATIILRDIETKRQVTYASNNGDAQHVFPDLRPRAPHGKRVRSQNLHVTPGRDEVTTIERLFLGIQLSTNQRIPRPYPSKR